MGEGEADIQATEDEVGLDNTSHTLRHLSRDSVISRDNSRASAYVSRLVRVDAWKVNKAWLIRSPAVDNMPDNQNINYHRPRLL
jgi:hypothetical protein